MAEGADAIILGGTVIPVTAPPAEAVAIAGERIAAVGSNAEVLDWRGPDTKIHDLNGAVLVPGFVEPHTHPDLSAQCYAWVDVSGFTHRSRHLVVEALRQAVHKAEAGDWVFAFGLDPMLTADLGTWDKGVLDEIAPSNPLAVMLQSMHTLIVNSKALQAAGVDDGTPDPPGGGRLLRWADGRLNGVVLEQPAINLFVRFVDQSPTATEQRLSHQYERYRGAGITTIGVAGHFLHPELTPPFEPAPGAEAVRAVVYLHQRVAEGFISEADRSYDHLRVQGVKLWYDGSPYSGTMLLDEPYLDSPLCRQTLGISPGAVGHANIEFGEFVGLLESFRDRGWQVLTHAQGDRATREVMDAYQRVLRNHGDRDRRWRLEHCALISRADVERAAQIGVALSFHVNHIYYYGPELREAILGPARAALAMPIWSAIRSGHRVSLHADSPMYPAAPLSLMRTAVTRRTRTGEQLGADEAITPEQALRAVTIDAAWQLFADDEIGSIAVGKYADLAVLSRNPLESPPQDIDRIEVLQSWLGGKTSG